MHFLLRFNAVDDTPTTTVNFEKISLGIYVGILSEYGGESGIRTHGTCEGTHTFQACALNLSAISP